MKNTRRTIVAAGIFALTASAASAQTWTGSGAGSWSQPANWTSLPASATNTVITFNNGAPVSTVQDLANPMILNALNSSGTGTLSISGNALSLQPIVFFGTNHASVNLASSTATINAPVILGNQTTFSGTNIDLAGGVSGAGAFYMGNGLVTLSGPGSWAGGTVLGQAGSGTLRVVSAGALNGNVLFQSGTLLEFAPTSTVTYGGSIGSSISAVGAIVRHSGAGTTLLNGASTNFIGTTQVTGGVLQSGNVNALGGALATVQVQSGGTLQMAANNSLNGPNLFTVQSGGTLDMAGFQQAAAITLANNGALTLPTGSHLSVTGTNAWTGTSSGGGSLTFLGTQTLNAGSSLAHLGGTKVNTGATTTINLSNALPDNGLLHINGGTLTHNGTETVANVAVASGTLTATNLTVSGTLDFQAGALNGDIAVNGAFDKIGATTAVHSAGTLTLAGGGLVSSGQFNVTGGIVAGALVNNATLEISGGAVNGPVTNNATVNVTGGSLNGATSNFATINLSGGFGAIISGTAANSGTIAATGFGTGISANVSGTGNFTATSATSTLSGINSYSGGSTATNSLIDGTTDSIQGAWALTNSGLLFNQASAGTMSGQITGTGNSGVTLTGAGLVTLSGNNSFDGGVVLAFGAHLGFGSNTAAGIGGTIQSYGTSFKLSAQGGARVVANPLLFSNAQTKFNGTNSLTFIDGTAKNLGGGAEILHTSSATTAIAGTFLGQNLSTINVSAGTLILGAPVNNGFRMDGAINVASGATLQTLSKSPVKLAQTNLSGGTLIAANGVTVPTGLVLTGNGVIQGRVSSEAGSLIDATGSLTMGDATHLAGFFSNGELRTDKFNVTLLDRNQATLGSITELGTGATPGTLTAPNGVFVDFSRGLTGWGTVVSTNALANASIINGSVIGTSGAQPLDFTGYVKGLGDFTDVTFSGTFSPGLSPAIVPVQNVGLGGAGTLLMEIGGLIPGAQYDQLDIAGVLSLDGLLDVDLLNGFAPALGDSFLLFDGATSGAFDAFSLPALAPGLAWDTTTLYSGGSLKVAAVPEPSAALLLLGALAGFAVRRRARR